jgi:hypothetical protein
VLWVRPKTGAVPAFDPWDYWECRTGDVVVVAERRDQWPAWLAAHPNLDVPTMWRVRTGDWVAWVGVRPNPSGRPTVLDFHRCRPQGLLGREPARLGTDVDALVTTLMGGLREANYSEAETTVSANGRISRIAAKSLASLVITVAPIERAESAISTSFTSEPDRATWYPPDAWSARRTYPHPHIPRLTEPEGGQLDRRPPPRRG